MPSNDNTNDSSDGKGWIDIVLGLRKEVPKPAQAMVAVAVILVALAVVLSKWGPVQQEWPIAILVWLSVTAISIAGVLTVLVAIKEARGPRASDLQGAVRAAVAEVNSVRTSSTIIGVHIGRTHVECGAIHAEAIVRAGAIAMRQSMRGAHFRILVSAMPKECPNDDQMLENVAEAIAFTARKIRTQAPERLPVAGIGIALPGLLDIPHKIMTMSAKGIPQGTAVAQRVAEALLKKLGDEAPELFGKAYSSSDSQLTQLIFLDNDAKAVARKYVAEHRGVADVACLIVDEGIGGGCVTSGSLMYGHQYSAGEVGHQILPMPESQVSISSEDAEQVTNFLQHRGLSCCSCGNPGLHWEMTSNDDAVIEAFRLFHPEIIRLLATHTGKDESLIDFADLVRSSRPSTTTESRLSLDPDELNRLDRALKCVADLIATPLGLGIASLTNVLDLEQVILTGRVVSLLEKHLKMVLQQRVAKYALNKHTNVAVIFDTGLFERVWEGAALLFFDAGYSQLFVQNGGSVWPSAYSESEVDDQVGYGDTPSPQELLRENKGRA